MKELSSTEKLAYMGLVTYPDEKDRQIANRLSLPNSTFASAKSRLMESGFLTESYVPIYPRLGMELLAAVYSDFNPSVSVEERVRNTRRSVEVYPEIILSMGESHRGFSLSVARNITRIMKISHERMSILAKLNLLEIELPIEVMFPFEISNVHRFFNLAPLIQKKLTESVPGLLEDIGVDMKDAYSKDNILQIPRGERVLAPSDVDLSKKQLEILYYIVKHPGISASKLSTLIPYSRHTISRVKEMLIEDGYLSCIRVPELSRLNYSILSLYHAKIDPKNPLQQDVAMHREILQEDSVFFVSRPTEIIMLAAYENYVQYNRGMSSFNQFLKVNNFQRSIPTIRNHSLGEAIWIKTFQYHPLVKETFDLKVS